jgi:uncharacterized protein (TIGR03118 family)
MRKFLSIVALLLFTQLALAAPPFYKQHNLISDDITVIPADHQDGVVVNAWGLTSSPTSPWWIANNGTDSSSLYNAGTDTIPALIVAIRGGVPTGIVFNNSGGGFVVTNGTKSGSSVFLFSSETGIISGWNPGVAPAQSQVGAMVTDAIYKGLAIAGIGGAARLYATNFHAGTVDVFDNAFQLLSLPGAFVDPNLPGGFAPFGIQNIGGTIYVTYALQGADKVDEMAGSGLGYVDAYDTDGHLLRRVASAGALNAPWGIALSPAEFGAFGGALLIGNFGDGRINAYDLATSTTSGEASFAGPLHGDNGPPLKIDGLWALQFGNGAGAGSRSTLFFTAGPFDESHGLFGSIEPSEAPGHSGR